MTKSYRQGQILKLIRNKRIGTQEELAQELKNLGIAATQVTLSRDIRELGVCCSFGDWQKDVNAIAVPVRPGGGLPPMAINCGAPAYLVSKEFLLERVRPRLIAVANELETSLGTAG